MDNYKFLGERVYFLTDNSIINIIPVDPEDPEMPEDTIDLGKSFLVLGAYEYENDDDGYIHLIDYTELEFGKELPVTAKGMGAPVYIGNIGYDVNYQKVYVASGYEYLFEVDLISQSISRTMHIATEESVMSITKNTYPYLNFVYFGTNEKEIDGDVGRLYKINTHPYEFDMQYIYLDDTAELEDIPNFTVTNSNEYVYIGGYNGYMQKYYGPDMIHVQNEEIFQRVKPNGAYINSEANLMFQILESTPTKLRIIYLTLGTVLDTIDMDVQCLELMQLYGEDAWTAPFFVVVKTETNRLKVRKYHLTYGTGQLNLDAESVEFGELNGTAVGICLDTDYSTVVVATKGGNIVKFATSDLFLMDSLISHRSYRSVAYVNVENYYPPEPPPEPTPAYLVLSAFEEYDNEDGYVHLLTTELNLDTELSVVGSNGMGQYEPHGVICYSLETNKVYFASAHEWIYEVDVSRKQISHEFRFGTNEQPIYSITKSTIDGTFIVGVDMYDAAYPDRVGRLYKFSSYDFPDSISDVVMNNSTETDDYPNFIEFDMYGQIVTGGFNHVIQQYALSDLTFIGGNTYSNGVYNNSVCCIRGLNWLVAVLYGYPAKIALILLDDNTVLNTPEIKADQIAITNNTGWETLVFTLYKDVSSQRLRVAKYEIVNYNNLQFVSESGEFGTANYPGVGLCVDFDNEFVYAASNAGQVVKIDISTMEIVDTYVGDRMYRAMTLTSPVDGGNPPQ